jgi:ribosome modulation factor
MPATITFVCAFFTFAWANMLDKSNYRADMVEGYEAYFLGFQREDCPYPPTLPKETIYLREGWLMGWDKASQETGETR